MDQLFVIEGIWGHLTHLSKNGQKPLCSSRIKWFSERFIFESEDISKTYPWCQKCLNQFKEIKNENPKTL